MENLVQGISILLLFIGIVSIIMMIPLFILAGIEKLSGLNLLVIHLIFNAFMIFSFVKEKFFTESYMIHGPDQAFLLMFFPPSFALFYAFGIWILKHYLTESFKYVRYGLIIIYTILSAFMFV